jgi:ParB/RepB/Spo0J family partition protein
MKPTFTIKDVQTQQIDPSPFQKRKHFDQEKLQDLAASIENDGQIEPIIIRPKADRYELIAGERRLRAISQYTKFQTIQAKVIDVNDLQARRISAAENIQRENLSAIESIEAIVEIIDAHLIEDKDYAEMGNDPVNRVNTLLGKLNSLVNNQHKQSSISESRLQQVHKFMNPMKQIFKNLPKRLEWKSFYVNDLPIIVEICEDIRQISLENQLNKSQIKAISEVKKTSAKAFQDIVNTAKLENLPKNDSPKNDLKKPDNVPLNEMSGREIKQLADKIVKKEQKQAQATLRDTLEMTRMTQIIVMRCLGIPVGRIAQRLAISKTTVKDYSDVIQSIESEITKTASISDLAKELQYPEPLLWHIALKNRTDQERFKALNWGLLTWDHWYWNDLDYRFGDDWPGRIPAQLIAHTLFYFTKQGQLVLDPMAGGGVVPDVCLAFHRRCWSFDLMDRKETRPEIEVFQWQTKQIKWPLNNNEKPDLIFIDPPYFKKKEKAYADSSISKLSKKDYLAFFRNFFHLAHDHAKTTTRLAFLNADWRNFQGKSALDEKEHESILISDYIQLLSETGWKITQFIDCPLSTQRFHAGIVSQMQKKRTLGVVRRTLIIARKG